MHMWVDFYESKDAFIHYSSGQPYKIIDRTYTDIFCMSWKYVNKQHTKIVSLRDWNVCSLG